MSRLALVRKEGATGHTQKGHGRVVPWWRHRRRPETRYYIDSYLLFLCIDSFKKRGYVERVCVYFL